MRKTYDWLIPYFRDGLPVHPNNVSWEPEHVAIEPCCDCIPVFKSFAFLFFFCSICHFHMSHNTFLARSFVVIWVKISVQDLSGSWCIKGTDKSMTRVEDDTEQNNFITKMREKERWISSFTKMTSDKSKCKRKGCNVP